MKDRDSEPPLPAAPRARFGTPAAWEVSAAALLVILSAALTVAYMRWPAAGLAARYWAHPRWEGSPFAAAAHDVPNGETLVRRLSPSPDGTGSAEWTGFLAVGQAGEYVFDVTADGGVLLWVGRTLVVSHEGRPDIGTSRAGIRLTAGPHPVTIAYTRGRGTLALAVGATGPDGVRSGIEALKIAPSAGAAQSVWWRAIARRLPVSLAASWALLVLYLPARFALAWALAAVRPFIQDRRARLGAWALLALSITLLVWGITWGLPAARTTWAPDEWGPDEVIGVVQPRPLAEWPALAWYPPVYYYVTALPISGLVLADRVGVLPRDAEDWRTAGLLLMRLTTVLMALATLVAVAACAAEAAGAAAAAGAALALLLTPTFVYYGKTANVDVPYLVWLSVAMLALVRVARRNRLTDYLLLGAAAAAAVGTKDQAYGFFVLVPPAAIIISARHRANEGAPASWRHVLAERKLWYAGLLSIAVYAALHNMPFNWHGFVEHVRLIRGFSEAARQFPGTLEGQVGLAVRTLVLIRWSMGWPLLLLAVAGLGLTLWRREDRWLLWLLVPAVSYYLTFMAVGGVAYDRFLLGVVAVLAVFAGVAAAYLWRMPRRVIGRGLVLAAVLYSLSYAGSIDVMLTRDGRYEAEAWMSRNIPPDMPVGMLAPTLYAPRVGARQRVDLEPTLVSLTTARPCFVVVNTRLAARFEATAEGRELLAALAKGSLGYREAFRYRGSLPFWATLQYEPWVQAPYESGYSNLDKVNPEIVIYQGCPGA